MARPTKLSPAVQQRIVDAIRLGATYELAAAFGGVSYETLRTWRETKPAFSVALKAAEGQAALRWLGQIEQAGQAGVWQAAAWKLERRYPQDYGRTVHEHQGEGGGPAVFTLRIDRGDSEPTGGH